MKIKQIVKIWLVERPGGWLCYQCLEMPEELRTPKKLYDNWHISILSEAFPGIDFLGDFVYVRLKGNSKIDDAEVTSYSIGNEKLAKKLKQEILSAFDEWSGGNKVFCEDGHDVYAWLIGDCEQVDWEKVPRGHPIWIHRPGDLYSIDYFNGIQSDMFIKTSMYSRRCMRIFSHLAVPLPENDK